MAICMCCGKPTGYWAYKSHGHSFCSINCMNKIYRLQEQAEDAYEGTV